MAHFESELRTHFADACVEGHDHLIGSVADELKDRHVPAAAVHSSTPAIVTFNLRHFREEHLLPWGITAVHPDRFLVWLHEQESELVREKAHQQAEDRHRSSIRLAEILRTTVPEFARVISSLRT